jgi:TRAP-type uncharacterized transport system substrate-binding protein
MRRKTIDGLDQTTSSSKLPLLSRRGILYVWVPLLVLVVLVTAGSQRVIRPAPTVIRMLSGPEGSSYQKNADKYKKIIEKFGVKVEVIATHGALENLRQLANPKLKVDVGFVQGGLTDDIDISHLMSLGSVFAQPLMVYYRAKEPVEMLSQLKGKRLAIAPEGSGAHVLAMKLLKANGIDGPPTTLVELAGEPAADGLLAGKIDAAFLMGDSVTTEIMKRLRTQEDIEIANFRQADGYLRKFRFLSKLTLPEGAYDLGKDEPPRTLTLVGPTVELVARKDLHPALSDLLISAAKEIHGGPGLYRNAGEYPAPLARDFPISPDAEHYYKSGGRFLYEKLPFWLANLVDRLIVALLPLLVVVFPATKVVPNIYRWWMRSRIFKWYGALMTIERQVLANPNAEEQLKLIRRIDAIENAVNDMKTPVSFADQLYVLRDHVRSVRQQLLARVPSIRVEGAAAGAPPA